MLLYGKPLAEMMKAELRQKVQTYFWAQEKYVAILFFGDNSSSAVYVKHKQKYGSKIGLSTLIFWQGVDTCPDPKLQVLVSQTKREKNQILSLIDQLNLDEKCVGIIVQLPLPPELQNSKNELLARIHPAKDIDGLGGSLVGKSFFDMIDFTPATPKAVMSLLDYYELGNVRGKQVAVIGQSTIVGKPLTLELLKRGALVGIFDIHNTPEEIKTFCQSSDYIFSATGQMELIDDSYLNDSKQQILIDIWYGHKGWKPVGDVNFDAVKDKILHITPVPWGIGPLTIASLFSNVFVLWEQRALLK